MTEKPSACIVNLVPEVSVGIPERLEFKYRYFGSSPGSPMSLEGLKPAKKTINTAQPDGTFGKSQRPNHVIVPHGKFDGPMAIEALVSHLFGSDP